MRRFCLWAAKICLLCFVFSLGFISLQYVPDWSASRVEAKFGVTDIDFVTVGNARVHVKQDGDPNGPPIVMLHGMNASLYAWKDFVPEMDSSFQLIQIDAPFHGLTGPVDMQTCAPSELAEFILATLDEIGVDRFTVVGSSWGGRTSLELAMSHPERVEKLVLIGSSGLDAPPSLLTKLSQNWVGRQILTNFTSPLIVARSLRQAFYDDAQVTDALVDQVVSLNRREGNRPGALNCLLDLQSTTATDAAVYSTVSQPTLILWGQEDPWVPVRNGQRFHDAISQSEIIIYEGVGHLPMEEIPARTAQDVSTFMLQE
jgi:pimeloyl-ACP methyl ester carboxylesterase